MIRIVRDTLLVLGFVFIVPAVIALPFVLSGFVGRW